MLDLIKNTLRFHTFNKFFFIGAGLLLFLGLKTYSNDMGSLITEPLSYGIIPVCAVVILNISTEMSSGGYRRKLTASYTKPQVFFAMILSSAICASALFLMIAIPAYASLGTPQSFLTIYLIYMLSSTVSACLTINLKIHAFAVLAVLFIGAMLVALTEPVQDALDVDKYEYHTIYDAAKAEQIGVREATTVERSPNPNYPEGFHRAVLKTLAYANPYSQITYTLMILDLNEFPLGYNQDVEYTMKYIVTQEHWCFPLITAGLTGIISAVGYLVFRKKDLR